ncbi:MAG: fused MFS/spermidine synthase, partial [Pseudomonadota bacterium]
YWFFGGVTRRLLQQARDKGERPRLLAVYGKLEAAIGVYALVFPLVFLAVQALSINIPHAAGGLGFAFDVVLSILLMGPPAVLMGGTIPFLTQGLAVDIDDATRVHSAIYGINTAGAFAGALAAGFFLIPALGLVGVMIMMGLVNIIAGAIFYRLDASAPTPAVSSGDESAAAVTGFAGYAFVALLTGFTMMTVQTAAIRIGALSFGSSDLTFSMVVAVFVLCIALGSFAVGALRRIPRSLVVINQWLLVALLVWLYGRLPDGPYLVHHLRIMFTARPEAFLPYQVGAFIGIMTLLAAPVLLSGASLPLLFNTLRDRFGDLGAVAGRLYSWNTVGSFIGALLGGYALLFWLDLDAVFKIGLASAAVSALVLGILHATTAVRAASVAAAVAATAVIAGLPAWQPERLSPGLFRAWRALPYSGQPTDAFFEQWWAGIQLPFYMDDPSMSVLVTESNREAEPVRSILVNGKSDSATHGERPTVGLLGLLPALFAEKLDRAFVIGYGTGISVGEIAQLDDSKEVIVAEISSGVVAAAPLFDYANGNTSTHPKVRIIKSDAYRALLRSEDKFDIIVSEPSNPWVTGVEMLYSLQFLEAARDKLADGGVFVQWFHQYATSEEATALVLKTYTTAFDHVAVWHGLGRDLLLLGFDDPETALDLERLMQRVNQPDFARGLIRSEVRGLPELLAHEILPLGVLHELELDGPVQTLLRPRLNDMTARAYFQGVVADLPFSGTRAGREIGNANSLMRRYLESATPVPADFRPRAAVQSCRHRSTLCTALFADWVASGGARQPGFQDALKQAGEVSGTALGGRFAQNNVAQVVSAYLAGGTLPASVPLNVAQRSTRILTNFHHHAVPMDAERLLTMWERCSVQGDDQSRCEQGLADARELLGITATTESNP